MERTKIGDTPVEKRRIRWKKVGSGSLRIGHRIIKPNEIFSAFPEEIPRGFRDIVLPLETVPSETETPIAIPGRVSVYSIKPHGESKDLFDVVDERGKVLNEKGLTKEIATKFKEDLES